MSDDDIRMDSEPDRAPPASPTTPPEKLSEDDLKRFVRRALQDAKRAPICYDFRKWYAATTRVTDTELRIRFH